MQRRPVNGTCAAARAAMLSIVLALAACGGGGGGGANTSPPPPPPPPPAPTVTAPAIVTHPSDQSVDDGESASFSVTANGTSPLAYQWRRNGVDIVGATLATYGFTATYPADDGVELSVVVTNTAGSATSNVARVEVLPIAPAIVTQPLAQLISNGSTATFSVSATGSAPLTYEWRRDGVAIPGATSNSYIGGPFGLADSGAQFDVTISNAAGSVTSAAALLTVNPVITPPSIAKQPLDAQAPVGGSVAFVVIAAGTAPFSYQWNRNGTPIPSETNAKLLVAPVSGLNDDDSYTVTVTNAAGSTTSDPAILSVSSQPGQIDLVAGLLGGAGNTDGAGGNAHFKAPYDVAVDTSANLYVIDSGNSTIRKMTPGGITTTLAGTAGQRAYVDATGPSARFDAIHSIAVDTLGIVYVADGNAIRRIALDGAVSTLAGAHAVAGYADGSGTNARFRLIGSPQRGQITVGPGGDLFVADCGNHVIRQVTPAGLVSTYAGGAGQSGSTDGPVADARFKCPAAIAFDADGAMYVADSGNYTVRKIDGGTVSTLAGTASSFGTHTDGIGPTARFTSVVDLTVDTAGNVFVVDSRRIRRVTAAGETATVAGDCCSAPRDGTGTAAKFGSAQGIARDSADNIYIADPMVHAIRTMSPAYVVATLPSRLGQADYRGFADGSAGNALFNTPVGVTGSADGTIYVADSMNCAIREIDAANEVSTLVGEPEEELGACSSAPTISQPKGISLDDDTLYVSAYADGYVAAITSTGATTVLAGSPGNHGFADGVGSAALFSSITGVATDGNGNVYVADSGNNTIRKIEIASRTVTTLAGDPLASAGSADGIGAAARFSGPCGLDADTSGNVYVADCGNHTIRKIDPDGVVTTIAGIAGAPGHVDGDASAASFFLPADVALDADGNVYVADQANFAIRKITPAGSVTTLAGTRGLQGQMLGPLPGALQAPVGIHARNLSASEVELIVTFENGVLRITAE